MASGKQQNDDKKEIGFAGLSSFVTDVEATIGQASQDADARPKELPATDQVGSSKVQYENAKPSSPTYRPTAKATGGSLTGKWLLFAAVAIGFLWVAVNSSRRPSTGSPTVSPIAQTPVGTSATPVQQPFGQSQAAVRLSEAKPPVGNNNLLTNTQLHYCLAEDIRLHAASKAIDETSQDEVDQFNEMVRDYNSRCAKFRYQEGALDSARSEVDLYRAELQAEGRGRFATSVPRSVTAEADRPLPDARVKAIQHRLNELGYDAGIPDGYLGAKTRSAIAAFQRDRALEERRLVSPPPQKQQLRTAPIPTVVTEKQTKETPNQRQYPPQPLRTLDLSELSREESLSLESACNTDKYLNGPAAYNQCLQQQLSKLSAGNRRPDLSGLSRDELLSLESACSTDKYLNGPAAYNQCLRQQLIRLRK